MTELYRIDVEQLRYLWCDIKHVVAERELGIEHIARVARHITESDNPENLITNVYIIAENLQDCEDRIEDYLDSVLVEDGSATSEIVLSQVLVTREDFKRFLLQVGHQVSCEEHLADQIKGTYNRLRDAQGDKLKLSNQINNLIVKLDATRLSRQKYLNGFLQPRKAIQPLSEG